jgi:hypothetical protein
VTNSEVTTFQACQRKWQHSYLERRTGFDRSEALERGTRVHEALAVWWGADEGRDAARDACPPIERAMLSGYGSYYDGFGQKGFSNVRVNVPFIVRLGHVDVVGEVDALAFESDGTRVIIEHKTTTSDVTPGSAWWREKVVCDTQPTVYSAAFPGAKVLYDVLHVPDTGPMKATPVDKRKYTKPTKTEPSRLYAGQRERDETDEEYITRVLGDMAQRPEHYFQRGYVVRRDTEIEAYADDLQQAVASMANAMRDLPTFSAPRTPKACHSHGRPCQFLDACWNGKDIASYPRVERNHSEEIVRRLELYKTVGL